MSRQIAIPMALACLLANGLTTLAQPSDSLAEPYYDLGRFHRKVSTDSAEAQTWFNRGLAMCYAFNHEEAVRCFERSLAADPGMPMALWGMAYAWGPNINNMQIVPHQIAQAQYALRLAKLYSARATELERDLIDALSKRYTVPVPEDRKRLNDDYADAMRKLHGKYADNPLVVSLFAESLMNLQPWKHWSPDGEPGPHTPEIVEALEAGLQRWPDHPALCHFYIHMMEASPTPADALPAANQLRDALPGAGHLVHMPSHIDVVLGNYEDVITANQKAIVADSEYVDREGPYNFYTLYRIHNYHFLVYGAMFDGQNALALKAARDLVKQVPEDMLKEQVDFIDAFIPTALHVMVRFGQWDQILAEPEPAEYLPVTRAIWHYARALAYATTGQIEEAKEEHSSFEDELDRVPDTSFLFQNSSQSILGVAEAMMAGEIAYREGKTETAFEHLREAVRRDDALNYDEPWGWMQPARHALGALLLEQGRSEEAEEVYRADLKRHPNNPWSLHGLAEALDKQGESREAATMREEFKRATTRCDVKIDRSCYCRIAG